MINMSVQQELKVTTGVTKVVHIITGLDVGGAEQMLLKLLSTMNKTRFDSSVISLIKPGAFAPAIEALGIPVYTLNLRPGQFTVGALFRLRQIVKKLQPDVIQGWMYHGNLAASLARVLYRKQIAVIWNIRQSLHMLEAEKPLTKLVIKIGSKLSGAPYKVIYNAYVSALQHQQVGYCKTNSMIIPNGFDSEKFKPDLIARAELRNKLGILNVDQILVGLIGRYHPSKDHYNFLQAAALLLQERPQVSFLMVGTNIDNENQELLETIEKLGIANRIYLLGESHEVPQIMAGLDILVSSSQGEAFPNVIGEAMACGIPCVVTDVGDSARIVNDAGVVVVAKNSQALMRGMLKMVDMDEAERLQMGLRARQRVLDDFSIFNIAAQYDSLYLNILNDKNMKEINKEKSKCVD